NVDIKILMLTQYFQCSCKIFDVDTDNYEYTIFLYKQCYQNERTYE
ncbi:7081_t:CDS:2, partial [Racocetra persica]